MYSAVGIFASRAQAEKALRELQDDGVRQRSVIFLTGERAESELNEVPTTDAERDGMGPAMGAVLGGAVGASTGLTLGSVVASLTGSWGWTNHGRGPGGSSRAGLRWSGGGR